jgi:hypothetical protein
MGREGGLRLLTAFVVEAKDLTRMCLDNYSPEVGGDCIITPSHRSIQAPSDNGISTV